MIQPIIKLLLVGLLLLGSSLSLGANRHKTHYDARDPFCTRAFLGEIPNGPQRVSGSGREQHLLSQYEDAVEHLMGPEGVAARLGIPVPPHEIVFLPSSELALLGTLGRHAIPHEKDGGDLLNRAAGMGGLLEFVTPGCPTCRSFYADTTRFEDQLDVLMHVVGHNHFAMTAWRNRVRNTDPIAESLELADLMVEAMKRHGEEEVRQWYYYIESLSNLQDLWRGSFDAPEKFDLKIGNQNKPLRDRLRHPGSPTSSVLQFISTNLPSSTPEWKIKILQSYERMQRVYGFYASNKIMNEGWATLMEEILAGHSKWATDHHNFQRSALAYAVAGRPSLQNPYWLGREAWRRVRDRFNRRPDIVGLTPLERDRRFIAHAEGYIQQMDDYDFLRFALDETFVRKYSLYLKRKSSQNPWEVNLPPPKDPKHTQLYETTSTSANDVVDWIASKVGSKGRRYPAIQLVDASAYGRNVFAMNHRIEENFGAPLVKGSAAMTMYVMSRILERPVSLTTRIEVKSTRQRPLPPWFHGFSPVPARLLRAYQVVEYTLVDARIEVDASGKVSVYRLGPGDDSSVRIQTLMVETTEYMQRFINAYQDEARGNSSEQLWTAQQEKFRGFAKDALDANLGRANAIFSHSPTAGKAISLYISAVERILPQKLRLLAEGKIGKKLTPKGGLKVRVLPPTPNFELDLRALRRVKGPKLNPQSVPWMSRFPLTPDGFVELLHDLGRNMSPKLAYQKLLEGIAELIHGPSQRNRDGSIVYSLSSAPSYNKRPAGGLGGQPSGAGYLPKPTSNPWSAPAAFTEDDSLGEGNKNPGDLEWGPSDDGNSGDGEDGEEGEDGEDGDKPDIGTGGDDSGVIEVPAKLWAKILSEYYELPNLRPKPGQDNRSQEIREGGRLSAGDSLWSRMMGPVLTLGRAELAKRGIKNPTLMEIARAGFRLHEESRNVTHDHDIVPDPDLNAVVVIVIDMSGSMWGKPYDTIRDVIENMRAILKLKYKNVKFRIVGMSGQAKEFSENDWFKHFMGGGTEYHIGLKLAKKILGEYPSAKTDKFLLTAGDGWESNMEAAIALLTEMAPELQYSAFIHSKVHGDNGDPLFTNYFTGKKGVDPYIGYADFADDPDPVRRVMDLLFAKKNKGRN